MLTWEMQASYYLIFEFVAKIPITKKPKIVCKTALTTPGLLKSVLAACQNFSIHSLLLTTL